MFLSDEKSTLETLYITSHIGSTPIFLYFDLYLNSLPMHAAHSTFIFTQGVLCIYFKIFNIGISINSVPLLAL